MRFILMMCIIGFSGIAAQVILMRELLVSFYGNEMTVGTALANWLVCEALGVYVAGRFIGRARQKMFFFVLFELVFSAALPLCLFAARVYKDILHIPTGEGIGLAVIFGASLGILFPVAFCHGALFAAACRLYPAISAHRGAESFDRPAALVIGRVYAWETIGTIIGGVLLTYAFLPFFSSFESVWIVAILNFIGCYLFILRYPAPRLRILIVCGFIAAIAGAASGATGAIEQFSIRRQFKQGRVLDYRNSVYGNVAVTLHEEQYSFFSNGIPIITTPVPDIAFVEDFGNMPLLFHSEPRRVLVSGAGAGGLLREVLKHPVDAVDYLELDPLIIDMVRTYRTALTAEELGDPRLRLIHLDTRYFLRTKADSYDVVLIGISHPADLAANRLFTREFFRLVRRRLNPGGILAVWMPGSLSYLSEELGGLNAVIARSLTGVFNHMRVIPGDYNIFMASDDAGIVSLSAPEIAQRLRARGVKTAMLSDGYISYRLDARYTEWFAANVPAAAARENSDFKPAAVFQMLLLWNKEFSPRGFSLLKAVARVNTGSAACIAALVSAGMCMCVKLLRRTSPLRAGQAALAYAIGTTGFFGMLANLILVFAFQTFYGYLYHRIGLLIAIFMAGTAAGSIIMTRMSGRVNPSACTPDLAGGIYSGCRPEGAKESAAPVAPAGIHFLRATEASIVIFCAALPAALHHAAVAGSSAIWIFCGLFFVAGACVGVEFPVAAGLYPGSRTAVGETAGVLYCADLAGAWIAGMIAGIACVAVIGISGMCFLMAFLKLGSFVILKNADSVT